MMRKALSFRYEILVSELKLVIIGVGLKTTLLNTDEGCCYLHVLCQVQYKIHQIYSIYTKIAQTTIRYVQQNSILLRYFGCEHGVNTFAVFHVLNLTASLHFVLLKGILATRLCDVTSEFKKKKHKKTDEFQINQTYKKHVVYYRRQDSH